MRLGLPRIVAEKCMGVGAGGGSDRGSSWHSESAEQSKTVASGSTVSNGEYTGPIYHTRTSSTSHILHYFSESRLRCAPT